MNLLLLRGFNNYFNRIVKKYSDLQDYRNESASYLDLASINFNPNDGVATELVIGSVDQKENNLPLDWENIGTPDYCVCYEGTTIKSRWFVLESERTRNGQYRVALKRDVLAEHFDRVLDAPCFVEKGFVNDTSSTLLYNKENMTYNQIKQEETLLKDETGCGWIVGYVSQDETRYPASDYYKSTSPVVVYENLTDLPQWIQDIIGKKLICIWDDVGYGALRYQLKMKSVIGGGVSYNNVRQITRQTDSKYRLDQSTIDSSMSLLNKTSNNSDALTWSGGVAQPTYEYFNWSIQNASMVGYVLSHMKEDSTLRTFFYDKKIDTLTLAADEVKRDLSESDYAALHNLTSRYIKGSDNKIYKINLVPSVHTQNNNYINLKTSDLTATVPNQKIWDLFNEAYNSSETTSFGRMYTGNVNSPAAKTITKEQYHSLIAQRSAWQFDMSFVITSLEIQLQEVSDSDASIVKVYIPATRQQCYDAPMDLFAIPYSDTFDINHYTYGNITMSKEVALQAACALGQAGNNVYDIQIVPYFPTREYVGASSASVNRIFNQTINIVDTELEEDKQYTMIKNNDLGNIGIIFWCRNSTFTFDIESEIENANKDALNTKLSNELDMYRLVSPNYSGQFEFSLAKSNNIVSVFNVDCTYKPYNPYIHVTPYLSGLYGRFAELDDARGLICGGDFSITRVTDSWENYQLNNKNYQEIFDRQIKNIDVNNQIAMEQAQFTGAMGILTGTLGGAGAGAIAGSKAGPYGAIAGAVVGGVAGLAGSAAGYGLDMDWLERSQKEAKSYAKDMFGYQLGNIQAMPNSLAKTTAMTNNNRIFPFVEYYTATQEEREILTNKIKYDGMTVMALSNISNFSTSPFDKTFVRGQLVMLEGIQDDFHVVDALYQEVQKGFYIKGE